MGVWGCLKCLMLREIWKIVNCGISLVRWRTQPITIESFSH